MPISINPDQCAYKRQHGQFMALYTYVNDERAMILFPLYRTGIDGRPAPWAIICDSAAWQYDDPKYLMSQAMRYCSMWDMADKSTAVKLATIIHEGLSDLIRIPPQKPDQEQLAAQKAAPVLGEIDVRIDGEKVAEDVLSMPTAEELARFDTVVH